MAMDLEQIFKKLGSEFTEYLNTCEGKPDFEVQVIIDDARRNLPDIIHNSVAEKILANYREILGGTLLIDSRTIKQIIVAMFFTSKGY